MGHIATDYPLLVIIGPSGAGKSSIIQILVERSIVEVTPTWTTRPPRGNEPALEHRFVDSAAFDDLDKAGFFLEIVQPFDLEFRYGLPKVALISPKCVPTIMLRAPLVSRLPKYYANYRIYQIEDSEERVKQRLLDRQASGHQLGTRLQAYDQEMKLGRQLADRIFVNLNLETTADDIATAIAEDFSV